LNAFVSALRHLQAHQDAAIVGALVAVVEQADVPARSHQAQELHQRARPLREDEAQQPLVLRQRRMAADHVADVLLGQLVVREVQRGKALLAEVGGDLAAFALAVGGQADEHMGLGSSR
jgi:hypothetical protein